LLVKLDALFEGVLGLALLLAAALGALDESDFPRPVGTVVLLIAGWALLVLCGLIWSGRVGVRALVLGNAYVDRFHLDSMRARGSGRQ